MWKKESEQRNNCFVVLTIEFTLCVENESEFTNLQLRRAGLAYTTDDKRFFLFFTIGIKRLRGFTDDSSSFTWCPQIIRFYNNREKNISVVIEQKIICIQKLKGWRFSELRKNGVKIFFRFYAVLLTGKSYLFCIFNYFHMKIV